MTRTTATPATPSSIATPAAHETLSTGAASVFEYVARTAEAVPDGVRWQTLSYEGEPHYSNHLHNGVAGISIFLADYHAVTGDPAARSLAERALRWCAAPEQRAAAEVRPWLCPRSPLRDQSADCAQVSAASASAAHTRYWHILGKAPGLSAGPEMVESMA